MAKRLRKGACHQLTDQTGDEKKECIDELLQLQVTVGYRIF